jgi:hypothetical protein
MNVIEGEKRPEPLILDNNANLGETLTSNTTTISAGWPYLQYPYSYQTYKTPWVAIDQAENGFIVVKNGKTFVCKTIDEISKLLSKKD